MSIKMIWAQSKFGGLGYEGKLLWNIPEDLQRFKKLTKNQVVVMGRKTWESLPDKVRPLPDRRNVVLTTGEFNYPGVEVARSVKDVLLRFPDCWIIGGAQVYEAFMPHADKLYITVIDDSKLSDVWAPEIYAEEWKAARRLGIPDTFYQVRKPNIYYWYMELDRVR